MTSRIKYQNFAVDSSGDVISGAQVEVRRFEGNTIATLYANETGATQAYSGANPFSAGDGTPDDVGYFEFWIEPGLYTVAVGSGASQVTYTISMVAGEQRYFASRTALAALVTAGATWPDGTVVNDGLVDYVAESGATDISDLPGLKPYGLPAPQHFQENTTPGTTDMTSGVQAFVSYCETNGYPAEFDRCGEDLRINGTITLSSAMVLRSSHAITINTTDTNAPVFRVSLSGANINGFVFEGFRARCDTTSTNASCSLLEFAGGASTYIFQFSKVRNLFAFNFRNMVRNVTTTRTTIFGEEGSVAWSTFSQNNYSNVLYAYNFTEGTSTGNVWNNDRGFTRATGAYLFVEGTASGTVAGDVIIQSFHGSTSGGVADFIKLGPNLTYLSRWRAVDCQLDAGTWTVVNNDATNDPITGSDFDNLLGGDADDARPLTRRSRVRGDEMSILEEGKYFTRTVTGATTFDVFTLTFSETGACKATVIATATIPGVGRRTTEATFHIGTDTATMDVDPVLSWVSEPNTALTVTAASTSGTVATFTINYNQLAAGTSLFQCNATVVGQGGMKLERT